MKNRSVDAGWLEAMQQQLQAIGLSKMSPLLVSNNAVASPNIASSGSGGSNNGTVNSQGSIMNSNNSGSGKDDGLSLSSANSVSGGSTSSGGAGGSINLSGGGASSSSSKETGTSMDVFMMSDEDRVKSSMMLASQEHFDRLFQLLSAPDGIAVKAWQLLRVLPLNPAAVAKYEVPSVFLFIYIYFKKKKTFLLPFAGSEERLHNGRPALIRTIVTNFSTSSTCCSHLHARTQSSARSNSSRMTSRCRWPPAAEPS